MQNTEQKIWPGRGGPAIDYITAPPKAEFADSWPRKLVILGSTGSIGQSAISVLEAKPGSFQVVGLACAKNVERLAVQANKYRPQHLAVLDQIAAERLSGLFTGDYKPKIHIGPNGYAELAGMEQASVVLSAQVGAAGLAGTMAAILAGKVVCLANKESLVLAGTLARDLARYTGAVILPVDSEHNAIFQCLAGRGQEIDRLILTASGGPFLGKNPEELEDVTPQMALKHPNWNMGAKISIDSATLMNKGLEVIEAASLYGVPTDRIDVLVHPQSIVHSLVQLRDGSLLAQMGTADMRMAIANCLFWPHCESVGVPVLNLAKSQPLTFIQPDLETFSCLSLARRALSARGGRCVVLNAANEVAVELFLRGRCRFADIARLVKMALDDYDLHGAEILSESDCKSAVVSKDGIIPKNGLPLCSPLEVSVNGKSALKHVVSDMIAKIEALDAEIRNRVSYFAENGVHKCC